MQAERVRLEQINTDDLPSIELLQPEGWSPIGPAFQFYVQSDFCFPVKYIIDGKIAGVGATIVFGQTAWLAHIIVVPALRNQGIGTSFVRAMVDSLKNISCSTILLLATPLGEAVYKKLGFVKEMDYLFLKGGVMKVDPENILPADASFHQQILDLDRRISGEDRSKLLIPHLTETKIIADQKQVTGFYAPTLVDGMIVAENTQAGRSLLTLKHVGQTIRAVLPEVNKDGIGFLTQHGFAQYLTGSRMYLGKKLEWKPEKIYNRIGGNFG